MSSIIEAKAVISAEDRTGRTFDAIAKKFGQLGRGAKISAEVDRMAKSISRAESAMRAIDAVQSRRGGFTAAREKFRQTQTAVESAARALKSAEKPTRELEANLARAQRAVTSASRAFENQKRVMLDATRAASGLGVPVGKMASEQSRLKSSIDATSAALERQIKMERRVAEVRALTRDRRAERATAIATRAGHVQREYDQHLQRHGVVRAAGAAAAGAVSVHAIGHGIGDTIKAGASYQHEEVALRNAGRTPEEIHEIEEASRATAKALPTASFTENLKVINETTGAFGSLHHAIENLPFMQKTASVLHAAAGDKIHEGAGELGNKLARFFEERQVAGDTPTFQREAEGLVRAMAFSRGNFNPTEALNFAQQAKSALPNYSERFLTRIVPSLVTMLGGDRAGTAANAFNSVVTGKVNDKKQAEEWMRYGLLDPKQAVMKAGHAVGWRAGAVKGTNLALSDPLRWMEEVALPAMKAKGVKTDDRLELTKALATMFRNSNSNVFANDLAQSASRTRLHKDEEMIGKAGTLNEIYDRNLKADPTIAVTALTSSLDNLMTAASSPAMQAAAAGITAVSGAISSLSVAAKDHPNLAMGAGVGVAAGSLAGAGWLSYQVMNGFGLGTSAAALDGSAAALTAAAAKLGGAGVLDAASKVPGGRKVRGLRRAGRLVGKLGLYGALAEGGILAAETLGPAMLEFGGIATGKYWQPKSDQEVEDLRRQKVDAQGQIDGIGSRVHPSMRGNPNPELDRLRSLVADLENRIASAPVSIASALPNATPISGPATAAFGLFGPRGMSMPWDGTSAVLPPVRPGSSPALPSFVTGADLAGKIEAAVKPDQIQANVKPDQVTAELKGAATVTVQVIGGGEVTNTASSGNIAVRSAGTSMLPRTGSGFIRGGV